MVLPPEVASTAEHVSRLGDADLWWPHVADVLDRHGFGDAGQEPVAGFNPTYPTFLCGDVVVKLFGGPTDWRTASRAEHRALELVATDPEISAPRLLAHGRLAEGPGAPWPYLVMSRVPGTPWSQDALTAEQRRSVARELGRQVRRVHGLPSTGVVAESDWPAPDLTAAAARSSLPPHLVAQVADFVAGVPASGDPTVVHMDVVAMHVLVQDGRLAGIIDWGDTTVTDPYCELIQPHRDMFGCDRELLRAFLEGADWPVGPGFARRSLAMGLRRQAVGLAQHNGIDVFMPVAELFPLADIATLDELADVLFAV